MRILNIGNEAEYLRYVVEDTFSKIKRNITLGYDTSPEQDVQNPKYSHTNLFSSIYGYEIEWLKLRGINFGIADIGCGEGSFAKIARDYGIKVDSYEITKPLLFHDIELSLMKDIKDIKKSYQCIVFNHVLEHVSIRPDIYLKDVTRHFDEINIPTKLRYIFISLPLHTHVNSHIASNHQWICTNESYIDRNTQESLLRHNIKIFNPDKAFAKIAEELNFRLFTQKQFGVYVFERRL
ncbi:MAG: methyltransferase domain-containing protein [Bacteroidales bacterium]|nr:methyltransferase domain-containing protein [Bacteroidales bacterium]